MAKRIYHVGSPRVPSEEGMTWIMAQFESIVKRRRLTNDGPYVRELEQSMAEFLGVNHCIAVTNATTGLMILAKALELTGEVIMPSMSFVATAHAFEWIGLEPVFADVDPVFHHIEKTAYRLITNRTSAIVGVHLWGKPCNVDVLSDIAETHNIKMIYDAAHAFGSQWERRRLGGFGDAEVFSLHATKIINSLEGGIITTNYSDLADRCRKLRNFGFDGTDNIVSLGINGKMHELTAVVGLEALRNFDEARRDNIAIHQRYLKGLKGIEAISMLPQTVGSNHQYHVIMIDGAYSRNNLYKYLNEKNIHARRYFFPGIHLSLPYAKQSRRDKLIKTNAILGKVLVLPSGGGLTIADVDMICQAIREWFQ